MAEYKEQNFARGMKLEWLFIFSLNFWTRELVLLSRSLTLLHFYTSNTTFASTSTSTKSVSLSFGLKIWTQVMRM